LFPAAHAAAPSFSPGAARSGIARGLFPADPLSPAHPYPRWEGRSTARALNPEWANAAPHRYVEVTTSLAAPLVTMGSHPARGHRSVGRESAAARPVGRPTQRAVDGGLDHGEAAAGRPAGRLHLGSRPGMPSPEPTTYPRVTGWLDTAASLEQVRRLTATYIASSCRRAHIHPDRRCRSLHSGRLCPRSARSGWLSSSAADAVACCRRARRSTWRSAGAQRKAPRKGWR
jgi:hypothetical protein